MTSLIYIGLVEIQCGWQKGSRLLREIAYGVEVLERLL
jgi:hypothetical protein